MQIQEIETKNEWDKFFDENKSPSFLQAWEWGELQLKLGYRVLRLGIFDKEELLSIAQAIIINSKRGKFIFIPHGPILETRNSKLEIRNLLNTLTEYLVEVGKKESCAFIRISPLLPDSAENRGVFEEVGYKRAPIYMHAENIWVLPLEKDEEELLRDMRKTTRYLIKKAAKDGVVIEKRTDEDAFEDFWRLYEHTAKREKFTPFSKKFIQHEFEEFNKTGNAVFLFGKKIMVDRDNDIDYLAAALIIFTKSSGFYHQGASIHTKVPVTYLLQWEAVREAKRRGCRLYNFWGIAPDEKRKHPWAGLSLFKKGFGGHQIDYVPTQDYVLSLKYYLAYLYEKILRLKRGS